HSGHWGSSHPARTPSRANLRLQALRGCVRLVGMHREFWINRWNENQIGFHVKGVNPLLTRFWPSARGRVLVPLCGKSEDLRWLAERRHEVVGVEFSLVA